MDSEVSESNNGTILQVPRYSCLSVKDQRLGEGRHVGQSHVRVSVTSLAGFLASSTLNVNLDAIYCNFILSFYTN